MKQRDINFTIIGFILGFITTTALWKVVDQMNLKSDVIETSPDKILQDDPEANGPFVSEPIPKY